MVGFLSGELLFLLMMARIDLISCFNIELFLADYQWSALAVQVIGLYHGFLYAWSHKHLLSRPSLFEEYRRTYCHAQQYAFYTTVCHIYTPIKCRKFIGILSQPNPFP
jgi:hypothetical protein